MGSPPDRAEHARPTIRANRAASQLLSVLIVVFAGVASGTIGAYSYYDGLLRPLAHTFGLWILLTILVAARQPLGAAVLRANAALLSAVIAFYLGKEVMYGIRYPGLPYAVNLGELGLWCLLAVLAGTGLGAAFHRIGQADWSGAAATAAAVGLLLADALRRAISYHDQSLVLLVFAALATVVVGVLADITRRQLLRTGLLVAPLAVMSFVLVSAPDLLQQLLLNF